MCVPRNPRPTVVVVGEAAVRMPRLRGGLRISSFPMPLPPLLLPLAPPFWFVELVALLLLAGTPLTKTLRRPRPMSFGIEGTRVSLGVGTDSASTGGRGHGSRRVGVAVVTGAKVFTGVFGMPATTTSAGLGELAVPFSFWCDGHAGSSWKGLGCEDDEGYEGATAHALALEGLPERPSTKGRFELAGGKCGVASTMSTSSAMMTTRQRWWNGM